VAPGLQLGGRQPRQGTADHPAATATRPTTPQMTADQWIKTTDGNEVEVPAIGKMQFVETPTHNHWHYLRFDTYELRDAATHKLVRPGREDRVLPRRPLPDLRRPTRSPASPAPLVFTGGCGYDSPQLLSVDEGISPGYGDNYGRPARGPVHRHQRRARRPLQTSCTGVNADKFAEGVGLHERLGVAADRPQVAARALSAAHRPRSSTPARTATSAGLARPRRCRS